MTHESYRLPDGEVVLVDATASKGAPSITYELKAKPGQTRGDIVEAVKVSPVWLTDDERRKLDTAIDSHVYWQLADDQFKRDGFVIEPGAEDPETIDAITEWSFLQARIIGPVPDAPKEPK